MEPVGTLTKEEKLPAEERHWTDILKDEYEAGASDVEVCKAIKITSAKFEQMMKENVQFKKLVEYGRTLAQAWWMEHARKALYNKSFNVAVWTMVVKNRFGWSEKGAPESDLPDNQRSIDEAREQMRRILPRVLKQFGADLTEAQLLEQVDHRNE